MRLERGINYDLYVTSNCHARIRDPDDEKFRLSEADIDLCSQIRLGLVLAKQFCKFKLTFGILRLFLRLLDFPTSKLCLEPCLLKCLTCK